MRIKKLRPKAVKQFLHQSQFLAGKTMIIGGSSLFHGAPLLSLEAASRFNKTVFFTSPEESFGQISPDKKGWLFSFIWVPFSQVTDYLSSVDSALIGPGFMRYSHQRGAGQFTKKADNGAGSKTKSLTESLLKKFPHLPWVIDAGSLQVIDKAAIPPGAIITPNNQEFEILFGDRLGSLNLEEQIEVVGRRAKETGCVIVTKNSVSVVASPQDYWVIEGGNKGLEKGGTGDTLAGLVMALSAGSNSPLLAASVAVWLLKKAAEKLFAQQGFFYNADDLAKTIAATGNHYLSGQS
jgi:NAD(P)H-hydrate epimerase